MGHLIPNKFHSIAFNWSVALSLISFIYAFDASAKQTAIVIVERAVIYADAQLSAPVGFVRKGKNLVVGDIARNHSQVYPIIVSGKIAYIRVLDVSTEKESVGSEKLVAKRFMKTAEKSNHTNYTISYINYSSQISLEKDNGALMDKDTLDWHGISLKGGARINPKTNFDIILNYLRGKGDKEVYQALEFGAGVDFGLFQTSRLDVKIFGQLLTVPFSTYAYEDKLRVNGYGFSAGTGVNLVYRLGQNFGLEGFGGFYYTRLFGFDVPKPFLEVEPSFVGTRLGLGLNYQF